MNDLGKDVMNEVGAAEKETAAYCYVRDIKYLLGHIKHISNETISKGNDTIEELISIAKEMVLTNNGPSHATLLERASNLHNTFIAEVKSCHN